MSASATLFEASTPLGRLQSTADDLEMYAAMSGDAPYRLTPLELLKVLQKNYDFRGTFKAERRRVIADFPGDVRSQRESAATVVYALYDPVTERVRYVGQTRHPSVRLGGHLFSARDSEIGPKHDWVRSLLTQHTRPRMVFVDVVKADIAGAIEQAWIGLLRGYEPLLNAERGS